MDMISIPLLAMSLVLASHGSAHPRRLVLDHFEKLGVSFAQRFHEPLSHSNPDLDLIEANLEVQDLYSSNEVDRTYAGMVMSLLPGGVVFGLSGYFEKDLSTASLGVAATYLGVISTYELVQDLRTIKKKRRQFEKGFFGELARRVERSDGRMRTLEYFKALPSLMIRRIEKLRLMTQLAAGFLEEKHVYSTGVDALLTMLSEYPIIPPRPNKRWFLGTLPDLFAAEDEYFELEKALGLKQYPGWNILANEVKQLPCEKALNGKG